MEDIIGRHREKALFDRYLESGKAEFVVIYGRRRIGKTFLVREFFGERFAFYFSGVENSGKQTQLENFNIALNKYSKTYFPEVQSWNRAFEQLRQMLEMKQTKGRRVVFIDELPRLDTKGSGFIQAFEYWWNTWASAQKDLFLIACGSATSWITNKLIKNRGGLHNRVTRQIALAPFTLAECEEYAKRKKLALDRQTVAEYYMIIGGVPYYWEQIDKSLSLAQNVDSMLFAKNSVLEGEFNKVYNSLFKHSEHYIEIVKALSKKQMGLTRDEICKLSGVANGGSLTRFLEELEQCDFIRSYSAFGKKHKEKLFQLIDFYSLFYLNFVENNNDEHFWTNNFGLSAHNTWRGYAFEQVCLWHIPQIKHKLGISGVSTTYSAWRHTDEETKKVVAQIDLVIDRNDRLINLCEMKYSNDEYTITKEYNDTLRKRSAIFANDTKTKKAIHTTMITTFGVKRNQYWGNIQSEVRLDDLIKGNINL
jgi:AAA+ ATPase superfamily predicted ATPase